jgi:hypothetical protein
VPFAAAVVVMFASVIGVAQAVEFDEKVKAPIARGSEQLRSTARAASQEFAAVAIESQESVIRDSRATRKRFDARWTVVRAVEAGTPLDDLGEYGLQRSEDGSVHIDLKKYPQWDSVESRLVGILAHVQMDPFGLDLVNRGMQETDVAKMAKYVAANDAAAQARTAALPVTLGFAKVVRKYDQIKRAIPTELVFDYFYQREATTTESDRRWLAGLLDALEPKGRRVLLSYFNEMGATAVWGPSDSDAGIQATLANFRQPDFEQRARAEVTGGVK